MSDITTHAISRLGALLVLSIALLVGATATPALAATGNEYITQFSGTGLTKSAKPFAFVGSLWSAPSGNLYIGSAETEIVDEVTALGSKTVAEFKGGASIADAALGTDSVGDVFVGDISAAGDIVREFSASGTEVLGEFTGVATKATNFEPYSLAVDQATGDVFVGDIKNHVVDEYEPTAEGAKYKFTLVGEYSGASPEGPTAKAWEPYSLAVNSAGDVYVATYTKQLVVDEFLPESLSSGTVQTKYKLEHEIVCHASACRPFRVAVAANGYAYVANLGAAPYRVERFSPSGTWECEINGQENESAQCGGEKSKVPQGSFQPEGLAISSATGDLYVGDNKSKDIDVFRSYPYVPQWATETTTEITEASAKLKGIVNPENETVSACEFEYGTTNTYGHTIPCEQSSSDIGEGNAPVTVSASVSGLASATKYYVRVAGTTTAGRGEGDEESFRTLSPPVVESLVSSNLTDSVARLHATINPEGSQTTYHFEYDTREYKGGEGPHGASVPIPDGIVGGGTTGVAENTEVEALTPETTYYFRVVATNARGGVTDSSEASFTTNSAKPLISQTLASPVGSTRATLTAAITPDYSTTRYHFEYGTTESFGSDAPAFDRDIGSGSEPVLVQEPISGLTPNTTYFFRVVATNSAGRQDGPPHTFTTLPTEGLCPNEQLRSESSVDPATGVPYSSVLAECRAYEQVTPEAKDGAKITRAPGGGASGAKAITTEGSEVVAESSSAWGVPGQDEVDGLGDAQYLLGRGEDGWMVTSLSPPASQFAFAEPARATVNLANAQEGIWVAVEPSQEENAADIYRRNATGELVEIGPVAPAAATAGEPPYGFGAARNDRSLKESAIEGASAHFRDVVYRIEAAPTAAESLLWPGDKTKPRRYSLYEYGTDQNAPALAGVTNGGAQISQCGTNLGGVNYPGLSGGGDVGRGISEGGSTIFFTAEAPSVECSGSGPAVNQVYARIGAPGSTQTTLNVAGTSECSTSASCNVTSPVTYRGASSNGSKVFFTSAQALTPEVKGSTSNLYECELSGDSGATPNPVGDFANPCPDLKALTATGTSVGADVQSVVSVSEEGDRVYFIATGALTGSRSEQGLQPQAGKDNLYLWEAASGGSGGSFTFITTLPTASLAESEATPEGEYLAFASTGDLTPGDTSDAAQVFRYDAASRELVRVSVGQGGFNDNGNTNTDPATLATNAGDEGRLSISDDGVYVAFQSSDALTPEVDGGVNNTYLWREGNVMLISEGRDTNSNDGLVGISANGENVFFVTAGQLVGQDPDAQPDIYDARVDGGFPAPTPPPSCKGEACQGALSGPLGQITPGSSGIPPLGNLTSPGLKLPGEEVKEVVGRVKVLGHSVHGTTITLKVAAPAKGTIVAYGAGLKTTKHRVGGAMTYTLKVALSARARASVMRLRRHKLLRHKRKLTVRVRFVPTSGKASQTSFLAMVKA